LVLALIPAVLTAQVDTAARDTTALPRDTTARDTTARDTMPALLPTFGAAIVPGPLPRGTRYVFTSDSVLLSSARTLSDLLSHIPGVYVARGGWYGAAEIVLYGGRGPASLEVYWDGVPMLPLGRDSVYLDPARIPLGPVERVDVIMLPAQIRVYLVTSQYRSTAPRTHVGIVTGQVDIADYRAAYSIRTRSGLGVEMLADWASIGNGPPSITTPPFGTSDIWVKADYVRPDGRLGASFQISSSGWHRSSAPRVEGWRQDRRDRLLRLFAAERNDGLGWRVGATLASSGISHDTLVANRSLSSVNLDASQTWHRGSVSVVGRLGRSGFPSQVEARANWMPIAPLTLAGSIRQSSYTLGRKGAQAYGMAGLTLPLGFSARAELTWREDPQTALARISPFSRQVDYAGWIRFDHRRLSIEVGRGRRDPFQPVGFAEGIETVRSLNPTPLTEFIAARASIQVVPGVQLSGWYFDPVVGGGDFEPPHHSYISATFYSKFWRVFKSGIFALRGEVAMESWGRSDFGGRDSAGTALGITGSSFVNTNLELQLAGVTIFWSVTNANVMRSSYVPGLGYPKSAQQYGARWFFTN
jgi:hypothetical protein